LLVVFKGVERFDSSDDVERKMISRTPQEVGANIHAASLRERARFKVDEEQHPSTVVDPQPAAFERTKAVRTQMSFSYQPEKLGWFTGGHSIQQCAHVSPRDLSLSQMSP
jgi:hypothetical protein